MSKRQNGMSLIEVVVFIVIIGVIATGILSTYIAVLRNNNLVANATVAEHLAIGRMEIIIGERNIFNYNSSTPANYDICQTVTPTPAVCTTLTGFTIASTITNNTDINGNSNTSYQTAQVNVTGNSTAKLLMQFANYGR